MDVIEHYLRDDELRSNELRVDLLNLKTKIIEMWSKCTFKSITKSMVTHSISFPGNIIHGFARSKKKKSYNFEDKKVINLDSLELYVMKMPLRLVFW